MLTWAGKDQPMKMRAISRGQDKKLVDNNKLGRALKFYSSIRVEVRKAEATKEGSEVVGAKTKIKVVKNKVAPPFKETIVEVRFGEGFDRILSLIDFAVEKGIIQKSGSWFSYGGERLGQGRNSVYDFLKNNPEAFKKIEDQLRCVNVEPGTPVEDDDEVSNEDDLFNV